MLFNDFSVSTNITFTYEIYLNSINFLGSFDSFPLPTVEVFMGENHYMPRNSNILCGSDRAKRFFENFKFR